MIIVHRWSGGPKDDWRPWLTAELQQLGYEVIVPTMPDADAPVIGTWVRHLAPVVGTPDAQTFFVGHSIGCQAILRYLQTIETPVGGAVFVAGWFHLENLEDAETEAIARPWLTMPLDAAKIKAVLPRSTLIISDNDPYGAFAENKQKFSDLGARVVVIPGGGHFTSEDGYTQAPVIVSELQKLAGLS